MEILISRREWIIALLISLAMTTILTIPYLLGYYLARSGTVFTGLIMNPEDSQSYFAKMLQGYDGHWLYTIPFTSERHEPAFIGGFYLLLGQVARWFNLSLDYVWNGARVVADIILFLFTFFFICTFLDDKRQRWTAYLLAILGSGLGWLLFALRKFEWLGAFPVDFKMPEAHLFFSALTFPHVAVGTTILLLSYWLLLKALHGADKLWIFAILAGLANLLLGIVYPFLIFLVVATSGSYWLFLCVRAKQILWRQAGFIAVALMVPLPLILYYATIQLNNEVFRAWSDQAITLSPPFPHYLVAYGIMIGLSLISFIRKEHPGEARLKAFLWAWIIAAAILLYAPLNPQRRYVQGIQVPLSILASVGLLKVAIPWLVNTRPFRRLVDRPRYSRDGLVRFLIFAFLLFMSISNLYILLDVSFTAGIKQPYPFFRSQEEVKAINWMKTNTERSAIVLAAYETGNYIAAHAGNPVVVGHWAETIDWDRQLDQTIRFYDGKTDDKWRQEFLNSNEISYVWYGPQERWLGDFAPVKAGYLAPIYSAGEVEIFVVHWPELAP
jgi:hypothetical protein